RRGVRRARAARPGAGAAHLRAPEPARVHGPVPDAPSDPGHAARLRPLALLRHHQVQPARAGRVRLLPHAVGGRGAGPRAPRAGCMPARALCLPACLALAGCDRAVARSVPGESVEPPDLSRIFPEGAQRSAERAAPAPEAAAPARGAPPLAPAGEPAPIRGT